MKLFEVIYEPKAVINISLDEIGILERLSELHYDTTCRLASKQGGFIYGMKNRERQDPGSIHVLTDREVQTLFKLTELGANYSLLNQEALATLRKELLKVWHTFHSKQVPTLVL